MLRLVFSLFVIGVLPVASVLAHQTHTSDELYLLWHESSPNADLCRISVAALASSFVREHGLPSKQARLDLRCGLA